MRITLFHPAFQTVGGAEILVASFARSLKNAGHDVSVVTFELDAPRWKSWLDGISVQVVPKPGWADAFGTYLSQLQSKGARAEPYLRDAGVVLACNFPTNFMLGASSTPACRAWYATEPSRYWHMVAANPRLHGRVTSSPGGITEAERDFSKALKKHHASMSKPSARTRENAFDVEMTKKLDAIIAISEFGRDNVQRVYGRTDAQVIYPIVRFPPQRARFKPGLDRSGLQVLTHTRLEIPKNVDSVIRAFALVWKKLPGSALHVVGEGKQRKNLETLARSLGIGGAVHFHGWVPENGLDRVYDACDVFALTPLDEPFGMVFPEAAARGLLLVGPDHGGPFEILDGGRLGWTVDPFSDEAMADAFFRIGALTDAEVERRRVEVDRACRSRFSENVIGPQLLRALEPARAAAV